jgi:hypothetical protein
MKARLAYFAGGVLTTGACWWTAIVSPGGAAFQRIALLVVFVPFIVLATLIVLRFTGRPAIRPLAFGTGLATVAALLVASLTVGPGIDEYLHRRDFNAAEWRRNERTANPAWPTRLTMIDDLLARHPLRGLSRDSVERLLGPRDSTPYFADWDLVYALGPERGLIRIDSEWLVVKFGLDGRVVNARIVRD